MSAENISNEYIKSIERLAKKNNIPLDAMIKYWKNKYETFNDITDKYDFHYDEKFYPKDSSRPFIALTVNGSIIIASAPIIWCPPMVIVTISTFYHLKFVKSTKF